MPLITGDGVGGGELGGGAAGSGAGAVRLKASLSELPLNRAVSKTDKLLAIVPAVTGNWTDDDPAGTFAVPGAWSAVLLANSWIAAPPDGAALFSETAQVALAPEAKTEGLHDRPVIPNVPSTGIGFPAGGLPEELTGGALPPEEFVGGVLPPEEFVGGVLPPDVLTGGGVPPEELGGAGGFPVGVFGGAGLPEVSTEIIPATPPTAIEFAAREAATGLAIPSETALAADDVNVTFTSATTPFCIPIEFRPVTRHV